MNTMIVPMFPLPDFYLFPHSVAPLHVFEERYRQMVDDQMDRSGRLVMGTLLEAPDLDPQARPKVLEVGGLGEILQHRRLPDGRYLMVLLGLGRVSIQEVESDRLYRQVRVEPLEEVEPSEIDDLRLTAPLREAILTRSSEDYELPDELDVSQLADVLTQVLPLPPQTRQELYCELIVVERARRVLEEHRALD